MSQNKCSAMSRRVEKTQYVENNSFWIKNIYSKYNVLVVILIFTIDAVVFFFFCVCVLKPQKLLVLCNSNFKMKF